MFSFTKLVTLIAIIAAVWTVFRWVERLQTSRRAAARRDRVSRLVTHDTVRCPTCGVYTPTACARPDCPLARPH